MLTKVEISTDQGTTLVLPLWDAIDGYYIKEIEGLEPVKATLSSSSFATMDGEQYQSSRRESRNIVIKLGFQLNSSSGSVRDLRKRLYPYFMPKSQIRLRFYMGDDETPVDIYGRIESFEAPLFTRDPEATISLICHQPDFYNPDPIILSGNTTSDTSEFLVEYDGSVETGILLTLNVNRALPSFTVYHRSPDDTFSSLDFASSLVAGDVLTISTISGDKGAVRTRAGSNASLLYGISPYSNWITLFPGSNYIRVYAAGAAIPYTIMYTEKFGGL
jgi:hypothetical protein